MTHKYGTLSLTLGPISKLLGFAVFTSILYKFALNLTNLPIFTTLCSLSVSISTHRQRYGVVLRKTDPNHYQ
jgi:hypothetical protein